MPTTGFKVSGLGTMGPYSGPLILGSLYAYYIPHKPLQTQPREHSKDSRYKQGRTYEFVANSHPEEYGF